MKLIALLLASLSVYAQQPTARIVNAARQNSRGLS